MKLFIDTDIILDLLAERQPHFVAAAHLFTSVQAGKHQAYTSATVFVNVHYLLRKTLGTQRTLTLLRKLKLLVTVVPTSDEAINRSLSSEFNDYEDAVQYYTALEHHVDALVTRNKKDYKHAILRVLNAEEVVANT